jgi:hypothetical protein
MICGTLFAQRSEIGFGLGTFNYTGDLARSYNFLNSKPAGTVFYRTNVSKFASVRAAVTAGKIGASDKKHPVDAFAQQRGASFNVFLFEASAVVEYHFLNWRETKHLLRFSPYLFGGLGLFGLSGNTTKPAEYSNIQGAVPFGAGIKYIINPKWYLSLEFGARKTFFDYVDNISGGDQSKKNYQYGNPYTNDAYYFLGLGVTHTFYDIPCPTNPYH